MRNWCPERKIYLSDFDLLKEELTKESPDKKEVNDLIWHIEHDFQQLESDNEDLEDEISDLKKDVNSLQDEVDWYNRKDNPSVQPSMLDSYFKKDIFKVLNDKYTWYQLEEILKNNKII
jgi:predicted nuclease with TOPRIM domain